MIEVFLCSGVILKADMTTRARNQQVQMVCTEIKPAATGGDSFVIIFREKPEVCGFEKIIRLLTIGDAMGGAGNLF